MRFTVDPTHETAFRLSESFERRFGATPTIYRAPGRVNLIGEHTDYNDGFVMPVAIDMGTWVAIARRDDNKIAVHSEEFQESVEFDLDHPGRPSSHWSDYVRGVVLALNKAAYKLRGSSLLIHGEVPIGAGLSSSAALEVATGFALLRAAGYEPDLRELAQLAQSAENEFVGARCGIMDQFIACFGRRRHALMLDCRSLQYELLPLPEEATLMVCNTMVKHSIAGGEYNQRRRECEAAVHFLQKRLPNVRALRDVSPDDLERHAAEMPDTLRRRCTHVVLENERVQQSARALRAGDLTRYGELMYQSHCSLRDLYEVSSAELDAMVEIALRLPGVYGARMTGGGFGGCTVSLVRSGDAQQFAQQLAARYEEKLGLAPEIYRCVPSDGVGEVHVN